MASDDRTVAYALDVDVVKLFTKRQREEQKGGDGRVELVRKESPRSLRGNTMDDYWNVCNRNRDKRGRSYIKRLRLLRSYQCDNRNDDGDS